MFDSLSSRLSRVVKEVRGQARISDENIAETLREVRMALLEADVALPVVKDFLARIKAGALGRTVQKSLSPGQALIKIVQAELISLMGERVLLTLNTQPPAVILLAGLQGAGKTSTVAKLGRWLQAQQKQVMVVSCDIYRPAAIEQLKILSDENGLSFFPSTAAQSPLAIAKAALSQARKQFSDVLIVDTAGRLHIDAAMMEEIRALHVALEPSDTLFVVDSMMGQDAVNAARAFRDALPLTGVILTKTDGDARGGAALSVRQVSGSPILFMGTGEKSTDLAPFHPERIASRILGMGDVLSLIEEVEQKADKDKEAQLAKKIKRGGGFDLDDFRDQLEKMQDMGGLSALMDKMPGVPQLPSAAARQMDDAQLKRLRAIINSMTRQERRHPVIIKGSRKRRIAAGSGTQIQDVNRLLKQFNQMQKMMKKLSRKGGMARMMRGLPGNMPPGLKF